MRVKIPTERIQSFSPTNQIPNISVTNDRKPLNNGIAYLGKCVFAYIDFCFRKRGDTAARPVQYLLTRRFSNLESRSELFFERRKGFLTLKVAQHDLFEVRESACLFVSSDQGFLTRNANNLS